MRSKLQERDFAGTPYVPVYVLLPVSAYCFCRASLINLTVSFLDNNIFELCM